MYALNVCVGEWGGVIYHLLQSSFVKKNDSCAWAPSVVPAASEGTGGGSFEPRSVEPAWVA